ncbi:glyoxylate/hydroxypyruvate reductase A [Phenylobacterium sp. J367]|uniref:2-hydroxyacid dehydrogenase n=1 Tax=Phenylobacterium sp. J367 TaxID=2898435 RepID=UPI002150FABE|nr:glyoxylate/hydroxypyruvate reductase A [Phenylobacterium sp. J367]MCR5880676.1 glyoxylate/hydroxypyruvate reductase A [Phenylobacterium sp. J367]
MLLFACEGVDEAAWADALRGAAPDVALRLWPEAGDPLDVTFGVAWNNPPGFWRAFPNLRAIFSLGAGVDGLLADPTLPDVPLVRMVDPSLADGMVEFVVMRALHHHRLMHVYEQQQLTATWRPVRPPLIGRRRVGVMGLGELGGRCARALAGLGFQVRGWSRSPRTLPDVETYHGEAGLAAFAEGCEILVCLLPLTHATQGALNAALFEHLAEGACLIQVGRGAHLVEEDLLAALASGRIAAATLDVFGVEPLPPGHPFWRYPGVRVVPHAAAFTYPETAAGIIAANIRRLLRGEAANDVVDRSAGY